MERQAFGSTETSQGLPLDERGRLVRDAPEGPAIHSTTTHHDVTGRWPAAPALLAVAALGVLTWATAPILGHTVGSVMPRPAHGLVLAMLLAAPNDRRALLVGLLGPVLVVATLLAGGDPARVAGATAMVLAQSLLVIIVYERLTKERPLASVAALVRLFIAIVVGIAPIAALGTLVANTVAKGVANDHALATWWLAASSSCAVVVPIVLGITEPAKRGERRALPWRRLEVVLLLTSFSAVLLDVFGGGTLGLGLERMPHVLTSLPFLVWGALRFGLLGHAVTSLLLVGVTFGATAAGTGAYMAFGDALHERLQVASYFLATAIGSVTLFAVALAQREAEERRAEAAHAQLRAIIEGAGDLIAAVDVNLVIVAVNPAWVNAWRRLYGITVAPGDTMIDALAAMPANRDASIARWRRALAGDHVVHVADYGLPGQSSEEFEITYSPVRGDDGVILGASQVVRSVTAQRQREREESEARRLEGIGRLAGGVAHDFNNLMTAVTGYASLIAGTLDANDPRRADLSEIERAAARAGDLTQQLLAFARRQHIEPRVIDPGELVEGFSRLLAPLLGKDIVLLVHAAPRLHRVRIDPTQFEQVVMNLAINARDAMAGAGSLRIELLNERREGMAGVALVVRDAGHGMSPEVQARIFEPFFTTKPLGEGTGLGLPTVYGIVHQAGGHIGVESRVGVGTTFRVFFPAVDQATAATPERLTA